MNKKVSWCSSFVLFFVLGMAIVPPVAAQTGSAKGGTTPAKAYWAGSSGGFNYRWTANDLTATDAATKRTVFSLAQSLKREHKLDSAEVETRPEDHYQVSFLPTSVVGPLLSYERNDYWEGGAHPSGSSRFATVDVRSPKRLVRLTDLFPAAEIRQALLSDGVVRRVLTREKIAAPPTLEGLVKALAFNQFGGEDDDMYRFPENLLENFSFHHVENGKVAVRFLLPHGTEIYRFRVTQIGILLTIPARLQTAFAQASTGKSGALMQTLQKTPGNRASSLTMLE